ncbi:MAG: DNA repair protein RecO [Bdellovibrionota bacterium]|jgi:recombinational DNA repair protein (RecF pathway)
MKLVFCKGKIQKKGKISIFYPFLGDFTLYLNNMANSTPEIDGLEGIIIRLFAYRDSDLIVRIISPTSGKTSLFAPRARKGGGNKANSSIDILDWGIFETRVGKGDLPILKSFRPRSSFPRIREDFEKLLLATLICEAFDVGLPEDAYGDNKTIFTNVLSTLNKIDSASSIKDALRATYFLITDLLKENGILDSVTAPSSHALLRHLKQLEQYSGRTITTKEQLSLVFEQLKREIKNNPPD